MNRKTLHIRYIVARLLLFVAFMGLVSSSFAQKKVSGLVEEENGQPLIGVTVSIQGTTVGTITDFNGEYSLMIPSGKEDGMIVFSFIGYETFMTSVPESGKLNVRMLPAVTELEEIVAIGYGTKRKGDLTGSVASVSEKDFNGGVISSAEQLINGKVAGVQITNGGGSPTEGSTICIRGGASLNASNDPLIVVDGVPLENGGIAGNSNNFLALINPSDIESMTVLKDASSTAIYGSRASNGVIIITTKKGSSDKLSVDFSTTNSIQTVAKKAEMLSREQFVNTVNRFNSAYTNLLGTANTDWQDEIFSSAFSTDNNLSVSGCINKVLPYRVSFGYANQGGMLKPDNSTRYTGNINLSPTFFDKSLKVNLSLKASMNDNTFANQSAIWSALTFNPTLPIYSGNSDILLGYTEAYTVGDDGKITPTTRANLNPVGTNKYYESTSTIKRMITNLDVDYTLPMLKDLKLHATGGIDVAKGEGDIYCDPLGAMNYTSNGLSYTYGPETNKNLLFSGYAFYTKSLSENFSFDATAGYDYQFWNSSSDAYNTMDADKKPISPVSAKDQTHVLMSYYGRLNTTILGKIMFTATVRRDGTSRFSKDQRWGTFPSLALAYRLSEEEFMQNIDCLNNLKIRASYGITGQQDGIGNYNYLPIYTISQSDAQYFGVNTYRPEAYVSDLKWETTKAWNFGIDFGFLRDRISGSFDYYTRKTNDLLASVPCAAGTNFDKTILTNVGNVDSKGFEFIINGVLLDTKDWGVNVSLNAAWNQSEISNLSLVDNAEVVSTPAGWIESHYVQTLTEGHTPYEFYLYHQIYDQTGTPIEGAYVDVDGDGQADRYSDHKPSPDWMLGSSISFRYKKMTLSTSLRANIGNYVFNKFAMTSGALETMRYNAEQLNNLNASYMATHFNARQWESDYYLENASFLKMDNISLNYDFGKVFKGISINAGLNVQNVFTVTNYSGIDPEISGGIDGGIYPRPRIYSLSLGFKFL
ncbi:MAG: SusC/RagA family TonB-linked outer membrane protein [Bacteroidales bacterium]|nr:SusC/RagA family TonB-linked outer membrane protein [Bacteroidales bacterium]